jgi:hypothetical protein
MRADHANAFILDLGCYARYLIALPLLVLAEAVCAPRLTAIAGQFIATGLIAEADRPAYERAVASTGRLLQSRTAEFVAFILAYALVVSVIVSKPDAAVPLWHGVIWGDRIAPTPAGWWGLLVSLPLLFLLLLGWLWRIGLWARFLWLISRTELRLVPSHPTVRAAWGSWRPRSRRFSCSPSRSAYSQPGRFSTSWCIAALRRHSFASRPLVSRYSQWCFLLPRSWFSCAGSSTHTSAAFCPTVSSRTERVICSSASGWRRAR